jgi:signal transduction histidine kinase
MKPLHSKPPAWLATLLQIAGTFFAFVAVSRLGWYFQIESGVSIFYPAAAVNVVAGMYFGAAGFAGIFLGALATPWQPDETLLQTSFSGLLNVCEGLIPYLVFRYRRDLHRDLRDFRSLAAFVVFGTVVNSALSAVLGSLLLVGDLLRIEPRLLFMWWVSDFSAALIIATPLLAFGAPLFARVGGNRGEAPKRTLANTVQISIVVILMGWTASAVIQNFLAGSLERERDLHQQRLAEATALLSTIESELAATDPRTTSAERGATASRIDTMFRRLGSIAHALPLQSGRIGEVRSETARLAGSASVDARQLGEAARRVAALRLEIEGSTREIWAAYSAKNARIRLVSLLMDQMVLLILVLAALHLVFSMSRPLEQMHRKVAALQGGAPSGFQIETDFVELQVLARTIDESARMLRQRELELQHQTERALAGSKAKSEFLAKMSHELRTPLNSIIGFTELLMEQGDGMPREKRIAFLANVSRSSTHLLRLINDLLDIAKIESGKMRFQVSTIDARLIIRASIAATAPLFHRRSQPVSCELPDQPLLIRGDAARLEQAMLNLLSNANRYSADGTPVIVRAAASDVSCTIEVEDRGIGIAAEDQERIFVEFEQAEESDFEPGGTGLGLALARRFVEAHDGTLSVRSARGSGSVFRIELPLAAAPGATPEVAGEL